MSLLSPQLLAFAAVAEHKTVHAAADAIHLTQTAVTQRIRTLEHNLKVSLFTRTRRGMTLTPEGEALLRYCQAAKLLEGEALAKIQGAGVETEITLKIAGPTSIMRSRIIPQCVPAIHQFPQLLMHFDIDDSDHRHQALKAGDCDFAIIQTEDIAQEMMSKPLQPEQYVLLCTPQWEKRSLTDILQHERIIDYNPSDKTTYNYLRHYHLFEHTQHGRHFANRTESIAMLAMQGLGYTTLTKEFAKPYVDKKQLIMLNEGKVYQEIPMLAWYERHEAPAYFNSVLDSIQ